MSNKLRNILIGVGVLAVILIVGFFAFLGSLNMGGVAMMPDSDTYGGAEEDFAYDEEVARESAEQPLSETGGGGANQQQVERLIIRTGSISIETENTRDTRAAIEDIVAQMNANGAFVVSANESGGTGDRQPRINMSIRVPSDQFDSTMDAIAEMGVEVNSRSETADDVTDEFVDLQARLQSLEAARERLLELMAQAETTEALLQAEQQLTQREAEIESIKGRIQFLSESARLSRIDITIDPYVLSQPRNEGWNPAVTFRQATDALVDSMQGLADFAIGFVVVGLPWLLILGTIGFGLFKGGQFVLRRMRGSS